MKKLLIFLLLLAVAYPVKSVGLYDGSYVITTNSYVLKLPPSLTMSATFSARYSVSLVPEIYVNDKKLALTAAIPASLVEKSADKYVIDLSETKEETAVTQRVEIRDNYVSSSLTIRNDGKQPVKVDFTYLLNSNNKFVMFSPALYANTRDAYYVATEISEEGPALGVIFSDPVTPTFNNFDKMASYSSTMQIPVLKAGESISFRITYYPFTLQNSGKSYPADVGAFMYERLIATTGSVNITSAAMMPQEKIQNILSAMAGLSKTNAEFLGFHDVDFSQPLDSLGASAYFKAAAIASGLPTRLVVGKKTDLYAWVQVYDGSWADVDPYIGSMTKPQYDILYEDPQAEVHMLPTGEVNKAFYEATTFLRSVGGGTNFLFYIIPLVVVAAVTVAVLWLKAPALTNLVSKGHILGPVKFVADGEYELLKEDSEDAFQHDVLALIKEKKGVVNTQEYAERLHYSKELIEFTIKYLYDQGFLRKKSEAPAPAQPAAAPEAAQKPAEKPAEKK